VTTKGGNCDALQLEVHPLRASHSGLLLAKIYNA